MEVLLMLLNGAIAIVLFGFERVEDVYDYYDGLVTASGLPIQRQISEAIFTFLLLPVLVPLAIFVILPIIVLGIGKGPISMTIVYGSLTLNAILWGEMMAYAIRLIRTGNHKEAYSQVFSWWRKSNSASDDNRDTQP